MKANLKDRILSELREAEVAHGVRILYACESGSRAWGFASTDSDYDVRFLYVHPRDWYLSIAEERDVIEPGVRDNLDFAGWDLRKALRLLRKSNPGLHEWLGSPIVYRAEQPFTSEFQRLAAQTGSPKRSLAHYLHMARGNFDKYVQRDTIGYKRYLYVARPVLACRWIEQGLGPPPVLFATLLERPMPDDARTALLDLLHTKASGKELDEGPRIEPLHRFLESELTRLETLFLGDASPPPIDPFDAFFRKHALGLI